MNPFNQFVTAFGGYLPNILAAVAILIVGWIVALLVSRLVGSLLQRTNLDERLANLMRSDPNMPGSRLPIQRWVTGAVFWIIMLFAIVAFLQVLNLAIVGGPLNLVLNQILGFIPGLLSALVLLLVAWVIATLLRLVIVRVMGASGLSRRLSENAQVASKDRVTIGETIGNIVYWLVFLLFLPAILGALNLQGILAPVQNMVNEVLAALPNILAAALILALGYLVARIVRQIVTGLLSGIGIDRIGARAGIPDENRVRLSNVLGTIVFVLILIPVIIAALNALNIPAISTPAAQMLTTLLNALPTIFGAALLLAVAYFVARLVGGFVTSILANLGFDRLFRSVGLDPTRSIPSTGPVAAGDAWTPSRLAGALVTIALVLFAVMTAANMLGFGLLAAMVSAFLVLAGNIILGLVIFGLGLYLASLADRAIRSSGGSQSNILATAARAAIIIFTGALALRQMGIGQDIVNLAFGLLLGAVAVAAALAFGLGGRDVAARQLERWRQSMQSEGGIPTTGKPVGESLRETFREDVDRAQGALSTAEDRAQSSHPERDLPETDIPPTGGGMDSGSSMDDEVPGGVHRAGFAGDMPDTRTDPTIPDTGGDYDPDLGDAGDTGLDRDLPNTGLDADMPPGEIPDTGSEDTGTGLDDSTGYGGSDPDADTGYGPHTRKPTPPDLGM